MECVGIEGISAFSRLRIKYLCVCTADCSLCGGNSVIHEKSKARDGRVGVCVASPDGGTDWCLPSSVWGAGLTDTPSCFSNYL